MKRREHLGRHGIIACAVLFSLGCDLVSDRYDPDLVVHIAPAAKPYPTMGGLERLDPAFDELVHPEARLEVLAVGFEWTEGPVWVPGEKHLLFSDIPRNAVFRWREPEKDASGELDLFLQPSGYTGSQARGGEPGSNGLALDPAGRVVLCEHGDRRVSRLEENGTKTTLADRYEGKRFNSPNDAVFRSNGDLYFTDPPYGLVRRMEDPAKELDFQGVYRLSKGGELTLLTKEMTRPNGIGFSPDETKLYVANSDATKAVWMVFDVKEDGTVENGRVFFDATHWAGRRKGLPDGMAVDRKGNIFATGPGGVLVFSAEGKHLGTIRTGQATANCAFGDDGYLYVTADMYLCRIRTQTEGL